MDRSHKKPEAGETIKSEVRVTPYEQTILQHQKSQELSQPQPHKLTSATSDAYAIQQEEKIVGAKPDYLLPIFYLLAIAAAELIVALVSPLGGIILHIFLLVSLVIYASFFSHYPQHKLYLALSLAPLIRILSLSMPIAEFPQVYWYAIIAIPLMAASFVVMRRLGFHPRQVGFTFNKLFIQLMVGLTGALFGAAEFYILRPDPLVDILSWQAAWLPALILLIGTGFTEEFVFRGVIQRAAVEALGNWGWVYIALLFTTLHIGYLSVADLGLVLMVGFFFGWVVQKTGSLLGVTLSHGITNIVLYLIAPFFL